MNYFLEQFLSYIRTQQAVAYLSICLLLFVLSQLRRYHQTILIKPTTPYTTQTYTHINFTLTADDAFVDHPNATGKYFAMSASNLLTSVTVCFGAVMHCRGVYRLTSVDDCTCPASSKTRPPKTKMSTYASYRCTGNIIATTPQCQTKETLKRSSKKMSSVKFVLNSGNENTKEFYLGRNISERKKDAVWRRIFAESAKVKGLAWDGISKESTKKIHRVLK